MEGLRSAEVHGDRVNLRRTHPLHIRGIADRPEPVAPDGRTDGLSGPRGRPAGRNNGEGADFSRILLDQMNDVNARQMESLAITERMLTEPDSVDAHDVTITLAEANMSLSLAKAVVDRVIRAYKEITGTR